MDEKECPLGVPMDELRISLPPHEPLSKEEVRELLYRASRKDEEARQRLIEGNLRLVQSIVFRYRNRGVELSDLFQVGVIGLVKAVDSFDLSYPVSFSTYAVPKIMGEITQYLREDSLLRISRNLKKKASQILAFKEAYQVEEGQSPTIQNIAQGLGMGEEEIVEALEAVSPVDSLFSPVSSEEESRLLMDTIPCLDSQSAVYLKRALEQLDPLDRKVILLRFFAEQSQSEVASSLQVSQAHVSRLEKRILEKLRKNMESG